MPASRSNNELPSHRNVRWYSRVGRRHRWPVRIALVAVAVAAAVTAVIVVARPGGSGAQRGCSGPPTTLTVAAPAQQFAVLDGLARKWNGTGPAAGGHCLAAVVARKDSNEVAAALGPAWDEVRDGARPDVWLAESKLWLLIAATRPDARAMLPDQPVSVASSPVVMALRRPMAEALGWPQRPFGWEDVVGAFVMPDVWAKAGHPEWAALRLGMTDPTVSTAGLAAAMALMDRDGDGTLSDAELTASLAFSQSLGSMTADTTSLFTEQERGNSAVAAFPAIERDLATYDAANPSGQMVPIYPSQGAIVADYPYAVLNASWVDATRRAAATQFQEYLLGPAGQQALGAAGLRAPDNSIKDTTALAADRGFRAGIPALRKTPDAAGLSQLLTQWTTLQRQNNVLVVLDTSGSMNEAVPGTPMTRLQLMQQTASAGFGLLTNRTSIGLWEFSSQLTPTTDYRELVPFGPLSDPVGGVPRVRALQGAVAGLHAAGGTGLYNTAYAAFHTIQNAWAPNATNAVLLITDGRDEFATGLSREDLMSRLTKEQRPDKPVQIIGIAVGPEADADALAEMSRITSGRTFVAREPAGAVQTLILAFAGRLR